jgi:hypothetical protein
VSLDARVQRLKRECKKEEQWLLFSFGLNHLSFGLNHRIAAVKI